MGLKMSRETFVNFLYQTGNMDMVDNWFVRTWWLMKIRRQERLRKKLVSLERQFLLQDLQFINRWQTRFTRLRYLNEDGILYSAMFKIRWEGQSCQLTQYPGGPPIAVSKPKGPMKFRKLECVSSKRRWFGFSRLLTWEIGYYSSL